MAHFSKIENGTVVDLIVVSNADCGNLEFPESEEVGRSFIASLAENDQRLVGEWFQTSYNTINGEWFPERWVEYTIVDGIPQPSNGDKTKGFRGNFGAIGWKFDETIGTYGEFLPPDDELP